MFLPFTVLNKTEVFINRSVGHIVLPAVPSADIRITNSPAQNHIAWMRRIVDECTVNIYFVLVHI